MHKHKLRINAIAAIPAVFLAGFLILSFNNLSYAYSSGYSNIAQAIYTASHDFNIPPELVISVIKEESDFDINALSPEGAVGLMQLMPETAKQIGINPYNPVQNIIGGVYYLRYCMDLKNGNIALALACYNAGPGGGVPHSTYIYIKDIAAYYYKEISR